MGKKGCCSCCCCLAACGGVSSVILMFFTFAGVYILRSANTYSPDCQMKITKLVSRGNTTIGPENSLLALGGVTEKDWGISADVTITEDQELVLSRDLSANRVFGVDKNLVSMPWAEAKELETQLTFDSYDYTNAGRQPLPTLKQLLDSACTGENNTVYLNFRATSFTSLDTVNKAFGDKAMDLLAKYTNCSSSLILGVGHPQMGNQMYHRMKNEGFTFPIAVYHHPDKFPFGTYFWMKTRFFLWYSNATIAETHSLVFEEHQATMKDLRDDGFCVGVYGSPMSKSRTFSQVASVLQGYIPPPKGEPKGDYTGVVYKPNTTIHGGLIALTACMGIFSVGGGIFFILFILKRLGKLAKCCGSKSSSQKKNQVMPSLYASDSDDV